jgi:hypothetical protein
MAEQSLNELMKEQQAGWDKLRKEHSEQHDKFMLDFEQNMEKFDRDLESARRIARDTMAKIVLLSTSIIGFTVTLLSIEQLSLSISTRGLKAAWLLLTVTIALGLLIPFFESRAKFTVYWRGLQQQDWDRVLTKWDNIKIVMLICYSVLINPRNLIYCKAYKNEPIQEKNAHRNAQVINWVHKVLNLLLVGELLFILSFIGALVVLLYSVVL